MYYISFKGGIGLAINYDFDHKTRDEILNLLEKTEVIKEIYEEIKKQGKYKLKLGSFYSAFRRNFKKINNKWTFIGDPHTQLTISDISREQIKTRELNSQQKLSSDLTDDEKEYIDTLSKDNTDSDKEIIKEEKKQVTLDTLNSNFEGSLFKINALEQKVAKLEKTIAANNIKKAEETKALKDGINKLIDMLNKLDEILQ